MRHQPSAAWYALPAAIVLASMAFAAFGFGTQVRGVLEQIQAVTPGTSISFDAGDVRALYQNVDSGWAAGQPGCEVSPAGAFLEPVASDVEVTLFEDRWVARYVFKAPVAGPYLFNCDEGSWSLGPSFGVDDRSTVATVAHWVGQFTLRLLSGLLIAALLVGVIFWQRRSAS